jgi:hypothetical protein
MAFVYAGEEARIGLRPGTLRKDEVKWAIICDIPIMEYNTIER